MLIRFTTAQYRGLLRSDLGRPGLDRELRHAERRLDLRDHTLACQRFLAPLLCFIHSAPPIRPLPAVEDAGWLGPRPAARGASASDTRHRSVLRAVRRRLGELRLREAAQLLFEHLD